MWAPGPSPWAELTPCLGSHNSPAGVGLGPACLLFTLDYRDHRDLVSLTFIFDCEN